jgi:hypothetical protein
MRRNLENLDKLKNLSKDRMFLHSLMEDLVSAYHSYCFLNMNETRLLVDKLGLEVTMNKTLKKNIVVSWMIALCKIYEKPSDKNPTNVNIHKFLREMKEQSIPLSDQTQINEEELWQKINDIEVGIKKFRETINITYMWRNKSLAHIDTELLLPTFKNSGSPQFDQQKEMEKHYKQLTKKTEKLTNSLYQVTEFTIEALDYMLEATQGMGMEIKLNKAYHSPDITKSKSEIVTLYRLE